MTNEAAERRWAKQVAFERSMADEYQPCDSCFMLPQVYDAYLAERRATVERIRAAIPGMFGEFTYFHPENQQKERVRVDLVRLDELTAILDAEAVP